MTNFIGWLGFTITPIAVIEVLLHFFMAFEGVQINTSGKFLIGLVYVAWCVVCLGAACAEKDEDERHQTTTSKQKSTWRLACNGRSAKTSSIGILHERACLGGC